MRANRAIFLAALTLIWGCTVVQFGGVQDWDRKLYLLGLGVLGLLYWVANRRESADMPGVIRWSACVLPGYVGLQLIPLPAGVLSIISPGRAELLRAYSMLSPGQHFATISVVPGATANHFLLISGYALVFLITYHLSVLWEKQRWVMIFPLLVVGTLEAGLGIVQSSAGQTPSGTYVNRDHYAGLLEMLLPFCVAYALSIWMRHDTHRRFPAGPALRMCAFLAAGALILVGILSSLSRMGFAAALFALLVMGIVLLRGRRRRSIALAALLGVVLAGCFVFLPSDPLISRFAQLSSTESLSGELRLQLWGESLRLYRAFPVFGCGLGGFESAFLRYKTVAPLATADYAHNDYLQLLIELGAIGFLIGAVLFFGILLRTLRANSPAYDPDTRCIALACAGAFAAIGLHSTVDFNLYIPANAMTLAWIAGVAASLTLPAQRSPRKRSATLPRVIDVAPQ